MRKVIFSALTALFVFGCEAEESSEPTEGEIAVGPEVEGLGKALFDPLAESDGKEDSIAAQKGLRTSVDSSPTAVWEVRNRWADTDTTDAKKAGMVWGENSGLTWDEKYALWVQSMEKTEVHDGWGETFIMTTPYGKTLPAPAIECAETALFLRATFASWYGLPFFVQARDRNGRLFLGHFGFRTETGKYGSTPNFKSAYKDYTNSYSEGDEWPSDSRLRGRKLGGSQDDFQTFLGEGARAGTYFDEIYLNKRVGYFMVYLLSYFGSVNLADPANLWNLDPKGIRAGDPLVKRYQRTGIGHVYVTKHVEHFDGTVAAQLISGSMPRRQPKWEDVGTSQHAFTANAAGGYGEGSDGTPYAKLGGGLKRWRTPVVIDGRWTNIVPATDREFFIDSSDADAIAGRIDTFKAILGERTPEEKRQVLLDLIENERRHLSEHPSSCSARNRREEAFEKLYDLEETEFNRRRAEVDAEFRTFEDYVFGALVYEKSKTCCWNSTTGDMFAIIMDYAQREQDEAGMCMKPTVFMNRDGGYEIYRQFAEATGRGGDWVAWSADEGCPQSDVQNDTEADHGWTPYCEIADSLGN